MSKLLNDWSIHCNQYQAPECRTLHLVGKRDGDVKPVMTTAVVSSEGRFVTTESGSVYELGTPDPKYIQFCRDNFMYIPTHEKPLWTKPLTIGEVTSMFVSLMRELNSELVGCQDITIYSVSHDEYYRIDAQEIIVEIPDGIITYNQFVEWSQEHKDESLIFKIGDQKMSVKQIRVADDTQDVLDVGHIYLVCS
jgi:hypothetical protein